MTEAVTSIDSDIAANRTHQAQDVAGRRADRIIASVIVVIALARIIYLIAADPVELTFRSTDDSYYYFNVARHVVAGDGVTFDGINTTNGFHPLWMAMLLPIFALFDEPITALRAVFVMVTGIAAISLWLAYRCLAYWAGRWAAVLGLCAMCTPFLLNPMINGLETGLLILSLWVFIRIEQRYSLLSPDATLGRNALLGLLLAFVFLSRLDGVFVVLMTFAIVIFNGWLSREKVRSLDVLRKLIQVGAIALILVLPFLIWNWVEYGHMVPISGALKSTFPQVSFSPHRLGHLSTKLGLMQICVSAIAVVFCVSMKRSGGKTDSNRCHVPVIMWLLLFAGLIHFANSMLFMNWAVHWWHFASYAPMTVVLVALAFAAVIDRMPQTRIAAVSGIAIVAILAAVTQVWDARKRGDHHRPWYEAAMWANNNLPQSTVLAMTDCGLFGYFCDRPTVNLDGVINGYEFQAALRDGQLAAYLRDCGVTHIADYEVAYREGRYRIRLPARLYRKPGGAFFATREAECYASDAYHHALANADGVHFAIWPLDRLEIVDQYKVENDR